MDRDAVLAWVAGDEQAWRDNDADAVARLFTENARYRRSPYEPDEVGHDAIQALWPDEDGTSFRMRVEPVAVEGDRAVVRVEVDYFTPRRQQYRDLWVLTFGGDGRVVDFEEWAYWPGKPYSATAPD
ncbi:MAG: nuclear transport factor 2 family protein [bacterium]